MFKKVTAFLLSAVIMAGASTAAFAESVPQTVTVEQEYGASAAKVWDGKTAMKSGQKYVLKSSVTISKKITIPKGATLTLNKGAKLTVGSKGTLAVNGKLAIKSGATLTVTGKLTTAKGSSVSDAGTIKLTKNKAAVTIGGTFTIAKGGKITGTPKSVKLTDAAKVTVKGTNSCKKLKDLLGETSSTDTKEADRQEIEKVMNTVIRKAFAGDLYGAFEEVYPQSYLDALDELFMAYSGTTFKDYINSYFAEVISQSGMDINTLTAAAEQVNVKVTKLTDCLKSLTDDEKEMLADCGDITKAYIADIAVDTSDIPDELKDNVVGDSAQVKMGYAGGRWYAIG